MTETLDAAGILPEEFLRVDGLRLRFVHARPAGARATVVHLHGRGEFVEKYRETVGDLIGRRFAYASFEWRGQGLSDRLLPAREPGHVDDFAAYLRDLEVAVRRVAEIGLPRPWVMLAHSMGGQVGLRHLHDRPGRFTAAVMTAPMWGLPLRGLPVWAAQAIAGSAVRLGGAGRYGPGQRALDAARCAFEGNPLTGCPERYARWQALLTERPELALGGVTYGWLAAALRSIAITRRRGYVEAIRTPVLVCQSGLERIVCNRTQARLARRLRHGRLVVFPDAQHEILMERPPVRARFFALMEEFLGEALAGAAQEAVATNSLG